MPKCIETRLCRKLRLSDFNPRTIWVLLRDCCSGWQSPRLSEAVFRFRAAMDAPWGKHAERLGPDSVRRRLSWWPHVRHRGEQERATQGDRTSSRGAHQEAKTGDTMTSPQNPPHFCPQLE
jgi:hypothetical protein